MRRAGAFLAIAIVLMALGTARADSVFGYGSGGASGRSGWNLGRYEVYVSVYQGARAAGTTPSTDTIAFLTVYDNERWFDGPIIVVPTKGARPSSSSEACETSVTLGTGQWTFDPTLSTASLDIPSSSCGAAHVTWTGIGDLKPYAGAGGGKPAFFFANMIEAGGGAGMSRQATASGKLGRFTLSSKDMSSGGLAIGAGASAYAFTAPTFASADMFRGVSVETMSKGYSIRAWAYEYVTSAELSELEAGASVERTRGCIEMFGPPKVGKRGSWRAGFHACGPVSLTIDPNMDTSRMVAAWGRFSADLTFTATGDLTPENELSEPPQAPSVEQPIPDFVASADVYASRATTTTGKVSSEMAGAISLSGTKGVVCQGMSAELWHANSFYWF